MTAEATVLIVDDEVRVPDSLEQLVSAFLVVNPEKRKAAEDTRRQLAAKTKREVLWQKAFIQPRNAEVFPNFAESRSCCYRGMEIGTQVHFRFDLDSLKNSPVARRPSPRHSSSAARACLGGSHRVSKACAH